MSALQENNLQETCNKGNRYYFHFVSVKSNVKVFNIFSSLTNMIMISTRFPESPLTREKKKDC